ncbi:MAG TPA: chemotaxis protein CheW [Candidatus Rifleibacterium sp.]|nr:chemotaxis protein CheW [Candidatus Rifleibacterium sp.]HPT44840.1 chemotaxis protein CheW [Candidatus Rifleibacterium sp.]
MSQILPLIRRLAQNAGERNGSGRLEKFFIFKLANKSYAIPAVDVTEVTMPGSMIEIPLKSDFITGVVNVRGTVIPVVNLRHRIGLEPAFQINDSSKLLIFTVKANAFVGMIADDIEYRLREGIIEPILPNIADPGEKFFRTVVIENQRVPVFMIDTWLEKPEFAILQTVVESY